MILAAKLKRDLIASAHQLKPVVLIGQKGLTTEVMAEIDRALDDHELIKTKVAGQDKEERMLIAAQISTGLSAEVLRLIGNTLILYRELKD